MNKVLVAACALCLSACATYQTAQKVSIVSFDDKPTKGKSVGNIRGEDCTWRVLGYQLGGLPTVDRAMTNARRGVDGGLAAAGWKTGASNQDIGLRYVNNVSTRNEGFDAGVLAKTCIVVTGVGYK